MQLISVERHVSPAKLDILAVETWPIWTKEVSTFDWHYDAAETCYILEGEAVVTPKDGAAVTLRTGDLVHFAAGLECTWQVIEPIEKHYLLKG
jgi:uncharacterized protein